MSTFRKTIFLILLIRNNILSHFLVGTEMAFYNSSYVRRFLDSEAYNKYHLSLVNALFKCSLFLAGECMSFDPELVHNFCMEMSREWLVSSSKDQFARVLLLFL